MKNNIKEKLQQELNKEITEESQVIYILSRIRKLLETDKDKYKNKYKILKFYCDWALHAEIDRTGIFQKELEEFIEGDQNAGTPIFTFGYFEAEFLDFLKENGFSINKKHQDIVVFKKLLAQIYSDTPLIVTFKKRFKIIINNGDFIPMSESSTKIEIGYMIQPLD